MKIKLLVLFSVGVLLYACKEAPPRRPVNRVRVKQKNYSIVINKNLNAIEDKIIQAYIKNDSTHFYKNSKSGFYYTIIKNSDAYKFDLEENDTVIFNQEISDINDHVIYKKAELGNETYIVDKQPIIQGLKDGLKLMKENDEFKFIFPSFAAYGFSGDERRIGSNKILVINVKLIKIKK